MMMNAFVQRYDKARQGCVLFHLEDWALFRLSGKDTQDYLQRISTADIKKCVAPEGLQTLFLNGDGRLVADCAVLSEESETYYLACPAACREGLAAQLDRFLFAEKVTVEEVTDQFYLAMFAGPARGEAGKQIQEICKSAGVFQITSNILFAPAAPRILTMIDASSFQQVRGEIYDVVDNFNGVIGDVDLYATFRIEEGCPLFGKDTTEKTIPLEVNLKTAVSFTKGCFPGQEIVARINNLGHPANIIVGLVLPETSETLTGRELKSGEKVIGRITSVCYSPALKSSLGLGIVKWNLREAGQTLTIAGDEEFRAIVVDLPVAGLSV